MTLVHRLQIYFKMLILQILENFLKPNSMCMYNVNVRNHLERDLGSFVTAKQLCLGHRNGQQWPWYQWLSLSV